MKIIDLHCHIIPGIDDGAKNQKETLEMLELMRAEGVVGIIATPHYRRGMFTPDAEEVRRRFRWMRAVAAKRRISMWLGSECYVYEDIIEDIDNKKCFRMAKSQYILVEFSSIHSYNVIRRYITEFVSCGYIPIIAHIERVPAFDSEIERIRDIIDLGAKVQVNAESILGQSGFIDKRRMWKLIRSDLVHYIASDSHGAKERVPNLGKCYRVVKKKMGEEYAVKVFYENQKQIIQSVGE